MPDPAPAVDPQHPLLLRMADQITPLFQNANTDTAQAIPEKSKPRFAPANPA
jgi:hypothetical protein